jgi:hypothetical protein
MDHRRWQWTGVTQYQTGAPFTVISGTDTSLDGIGNDRAKLTGLPFEPPADRTDGLVQRRGVHEGDNLTFGDAPKGAYTGPPLRNWDMGL